MRKRSIILGSLLAGGLLAVPVAAAADDSVRITGAEPGSVRITDDSVRITDDSVRITGATEREW